MAYKKKVKVDTDKNGYSVFKQMPNIERGVFSVFDIESDLENTPFKDDGEVRMVGVRDKAPVAEEKHKHCGSVDKFDSYLKAYEHSKADFYVISYGLTRKILYGKNSFVFNGVKGQKKPLGTHLISLVRKDIDKLVDEGFNVPKIPKNKPYLTFLNHKNLDWFGEGEEALAIDINHCYWRTSYLLKFITDETYAKGIEKSEYKDGRLIAIGTLGKTITIKKYKAGIKIEEYVDDRDYIKYGGFFWAVIAKVYALMLDLWNTLGEDFLMFLTDCVVINPNRRLDAIKIMEKHGYGTKEYGLVFTEITDIKVAWITDEGEPKHIIHNKLLGQKK